MIYCIEHKKDFACGFLVWKTVVDKQKSYLVTGITVRPGGVTVARLALSGQRRPPVALGAELAAQTMGVGSAGTLASHWVTHLGQGTVWGAGTF